MHLSFKTKITCPLTTMGGLLHVSGDDAKKVKRIQQMAILDGVLINGRSNKVRVLGALSALLDNVQLSFSGSGQLDASFCFKNSQALEHAINKRLSAHYPNYDFKRMTSLPAMGKPKKIILKQSKWPDRVYVLIKAPNQTQVLWYRLDGQVPCYRLKKDIKQGEKLSGFSYALGECPLSRYNYAGKPLIQSVIANKRLAKGHILLVSDLKKKALVSKGEQLEMQVKEAGVRLQVPVIAVNHGEKNELITVKDPSGRRYVMAVVTHHHGMFKEVLHDKSV